MIRYIHLDCEMGGRDLQYSLLTAAFIVTDDQMNDFVPSRVYESNVLNLKVRPDDGNYLVSGQGMSVNKIDLVSHHSLARSYKDVKGQVYDFLKRMSEDGKVKLTPVGHGIRGDIDVVIKYLISEGSWHQFCTYHFIDTSVVLQFLRACGKMPFNCDGSVEALAQYFNINQKAGDDAQYHDALFDATITAKILKKMIDLTKNEDSLLRDK